MAQKPHAVCIPYPAQGHINPMLKFAKILHQKGFHITFVNTEFNHRRLLRSRGPNSLDSLPSFRFETIPDGMPPSNPDATQDIPLLCKSTTTKCLTPFKELLKKLNSSDDAPPVTCIVSDGIMSFTVDAADDFGIPEVLFWTTSAAGFYGYVNYPEVYRRGLTPLKDESYMTNGYLNTVLDWIPGMNKIRLKDLPSFVRTTNKDDYMLKFVFGEVKRAKRVSAIFFNTFEALEHEILHELSLVLPPIYSIGPLHFLPNQLDQDDDLKSIGSNLWKEETECIEWLDTKEPNSVVYVNFGSITVMTPSQLVEFSWGLANSNQTFLWIIRPDLVSGDSAVLAAEFVEETKERGMLANWCPQEQVLNHPSIGGFLTHSGWNSTMESLSSGVPMICWPFFAEQQTNCWFSVNEWGVGMEIDNNVKRDEVCDLVKELMVGEKGKELKKNAMEWKKKGEESVELGFANLENLIQNVLLDPKH
jgi:hypothetical protein